MNKLKYITFVLLLCLCACNTSINSNVITDTISTQKPQTQYNVIKLPDKHMIFEYLEDAMNRDTTFPRKLVVSQSYYEKSAINRGDIIYMEFSDSFIKEHFSITDQEQIQLYQRKVSRVIGLPGEVIHISKGQIYINNKKLDTFYGHQTFHNQPVASEEGLTMAKNIKVPENHVFVMPDEWWRGSVDSSGIGPIDHSYIKGKVVGYVTE